MTPQLRPYQERLVAEVRDAFRAHRRVLMQAATGAGKTIIFAHIAAGAAARGRRTCILAHRRELIEQASAKLTWAGVEHGTITAEQRLPVRMQTVVASIQTLARRLEHYRDAFDFLVLDECHHSTSHQWQEVLSAYPAAKILGVTATPERLDSRGLGTVFETMVLGPPMQELIDGGYLAPYLAFTVPGGGPDLSGIKTVAGDYKRDQLAEMMSRTPLVGDPVEHYRQHLDGRPAIAFCVTVEHAETVAAQFRDAGLSSVSVDGKLDKTERKRRINGLADGSLKALTSCELISEGLDVPNVAGVILLRPTKSLGLCLQQVGRALRPKEDGRPAVILDHAGNIERHGLPCQPRDWSLAGRKKGERSAPIKACPECFAMMAASVRACEQCDHVFAPGEGTRELPETVGGQLIDARARWLDDRGRLKVPKTRDGIDRAVSECRSIDDLKGLRRALGFKAGWERHVARAKGMVA